MIFQPYFHTPLLNSYVNFQNLIFNYFSQFRIVDLMNEYLIF